MLQSKQQTFLWRYLHVSNDHTNPDTNPIRHLRRVNRKLQNVAKISGGITGWKSPGGNFLGEITGGIHRGEITGGITCFSLYVHVPVCIQLCLYDFYMDAFTYACRPIKLSMYMDVPMSVCIYMYVCMMYLGVWLCM